MEEKEVKQDFGKICTYCGKPDANSDDHVPPKQLLPKPLASHPKPIIVPAHKGCNVGFREDDEYFCSFILSTRDIHPAADEPLSRLLRGIWKSQNKKFREKLQAEVIPTGIYGPDGEEIHRFKKEGKRVDRVLKRFIQAIARFEFGTIYIDPVRISVVHGHIDWSLFDEKRRVLGRVAYTNAFRFFCQFDPQDGQRSTWLLVFYEKIPFQLSVLADKEVQRRVQGQI